MRAELLKKSLQYNPAKPAGNTALSDIKSTLAKKPTTAEMEAEMREKGKQKFLEPSAEKRRMYHGSKEPNIKEFKTRKEMTNESNMTGHYADERDAVFLSPEPDFTNKFSLMGYTDLDKAPTTYPVYVQAKNPFDFDNSEHLDRVKQAYFNLYHSPTSDFYNPNLYDSERSLDLHNFNKRVDRLPEDVNNWPVIENEKFQLALKNLGFDSFYTREHGTKNLGVYDPRTIKSAIGNRGTYDINDPDITKADGGVIHMAGGGTPSQEFPIQPSLDDMRLAIARNRAGQPVQNAGDMIPGAVRGLGNTILGAGRGALASGAGWMTDLINSVDIPKVMTGESYQIPYGIQYFKEHLPFAPTSQEGKVAQELGEFAPLPISEGVQAVKAGVKKFAPEVSAALHQAYTTGEGPLGKLVTSGGTNAMHAAPTEGNLSREEYSRMMREKYAAENAAKAAKKEAAPVTMADLKPKEIKVPADDLGFYSAAEKAAANLKRNIADGELMLSDLKKFPDVTPDELAATGLEEWLKGKKTVTKDQIKNYMAKNRLELEEVKYEAGKGNADEMKFDSGDVIHDDDYIQARADDIVYDWDHIGHESRDDIRARILEDADPDEAEHLIASGKIDDLVEQQIGELAHESASAEYYDNPYRNYRNDMGYEIVGNNDVGYSVTDPRGNPIRMNREAYDVETAEGYARDHAMENGYLDKGETKFHDYQLPGGENYREILLKTPSRKQKLEEDIRDLRHSMENPGNDPRELREMQKELDKLNSDYKYAENNDYESSHWDEPNVIAHMRLQDRVDSEGNKILYVDEMQSDWHQEGRRQGYETKEDEIALSQAQKELGALRDKQNEIWQQKADRNRELAKEYADIQDPVMKTNVGSLDYAKLKDSSLNDLQNAYNQISKEVDAASKVVDKYKNKVPLGPFADNWHKLALKRVMKYAADNGYNRVGFSKSVPQIDRWGTDIVAWQKEPLEGWRVTATEQRGGRAGNVNIEDDARARGILQDYSNVKIKDRDQLYATVAKIGRGKSEEELQKLTDRVWKQMQEKDAGYVAPREAGMKKFYDEELEAALKKYANQFKGKYGQTTLDVPREGKQTINYIDITPDLKKSTTKGQPYKVGGAVSMAKGRSINKPDIDQMKYELLRGK